MTARTMTIDLTPTWGEFGLMYARFAESGELATVSKLRPELAKAMAAAQALLELGETLTPEQRVLRDQVLQQELGKQLAWCNSSTPPSAQCTPEEG